MPSLGFEMREVWLDRARTFVFGFDTAEKYATAGFDLRSGEHHLQAMPDRTMRPVFRRARTATARRGHGSPFA